MTIRKLDTGTLSISLQDNEDVDFSVTSSYGHSTIFLNREQLEKLHTEIGEWLIDNE